MSVPGCSPYLKILARYNIIPLCLPEYLSTDIFDMTAGVEVLNLEDTFVSSCGAGLRKKNIKTLSSNDRKVRAVKNANKLIVNSNSSSHVHYRLLI